MQVLGAQSSAPGHDGNAQERTLPEVLIGRREESKEVQRIPTRARSDILLIPKRLEAGVDILVENPLLPRISCYLMAGTNVRLLR